VGKAICNGVTGSGFLGVRRRSTSGLRVQFESPCTDTDFDCIRTLVNQHTGIVLSLITFR
jgi:hypothetical protein